MRFFLKAVFAAAMLVLFGSCNPAPQPINFGSDLCEHCRMMITDAQFGSQILNKQSRSFRFDSVECMAAYDLENKDRGNIHSRWVPDFLNPDVWVDAEKAFYLHSETLRSPMGMFLSAYESKASAAAMRSLYGGRIIGYNEVLDLVQKSRMEMRENGGAGMRGAGADNPKHV